MSAKRQYTKAIQKDTKIRILGMEDPLAIFRSKKDALLFAKEFIRLVDEQIATHLELVRRKNGKIW